MVFGHTFSRRYTERIVEGKLTQTVLDYVCLTNDALFTPTRFEAWREHFTPIYLANIKRAQEEQAAKDAEASAARQAKLASKDKEITEARERLTALTHERALI